MDLSFNKSSGTFVAQFSVPLIHPHYQVVKTDPFTLYAFSKAKKYFCRYEYEFDKYFVIDNSNDDPCTRRLHHQWYEEKVLLTTEVADECEQFQPSNFFRQKECELSATVNFTKTIMVKVRYFKTVYQTVYL